MEYIENLFEDEVRNDFTVTSKRKRIWNVELEMLTLVEKICSQYNLKYWLDFGTLLGAIRHSGFVPWDDDIDISMPRPDYQIFQKVAPRHLSYPFFLQNIYNDGKWLFSKLRNSETSCICYPDDTLNQGIFIDIFPLDSVPSNDDAKSLAVYETELELYMLGSNETAFAHKLESGRCILPLDIINTLKKSGSLASFQYYEQFAASNYGCTDTISFLPWVFSSNNFSIGRKKSWFDSIIHVPFEKMVVPVPAFYQEILSSTYGDYLTIRKGTTLHEGAIFDPDVPYTVKINSLRL